MTKMPRMFSKSMLQLSLLLLCSIFLGACQQGGESDLSRIERMRETGKLELLEISSEEIFLISGSGHTLMSLRSVQDASEYLEDALRVGDRIGVYSFTYYGVAYMDLSELALEDVQISSGGKGIVLQLPQVHIEPAGRSGTLKLLHERVTGTKSPITTAERTKMQDKASAMAREKLRKGAPLYEDLRQRAEAKARAYFTGYLRSQGFQHIDIKIAR